MTFKTNTLAVRSDPSYDDGYLRDRSFLNEVGQPLSTFDHPSPSDPDRPWRLCEDDSCEFGPGHYHPAPLADLLIPAEGVE